MLSKRWHGGRLDSPRSVWNLHADRAGDWWPSSVPLTNQLSTTRTHTEQGVQIHLLWEFVGWISEEAWDQVLYHWRRSSSSTFKQDVLQLLSTFSTILVPSNSNLRYIHKANFKTPISINLRGLSKVLLQVRSFAGNVLYEPQDLQPIERWQQWRKRVREEEAPWKPLIWIWDFTFFF